MESSNAKLWDHDLGDSPFFAGKECWEGLLQIRKSNVLMIHCCKKWFDLASSVLSSVLFYPDNPSVNQSVNQSS